MDICHFAVVNKMTIILYFVLYILQTYAVQAKIRFPRSSILGQTLDQLHNDKNDFHITRERRSLSSGSDKSCKDRLDETAEKKIKKFPFPLKNDRNMDLQLIFLGENSETQVLLTTMNHKFLNFFVMHRESSNLYQSTDGGRTFQKVDKIGTAEIRSNHGIVKSLLDNNWIILVSFTKPSSIFNVLSLQIQNSVLLVSKNAGMNFTSHILPFKLRDNEQLLFHPKKKEWIIALEERKSIFTFSMGKFTEYGQAWISKDFGKTWKAMMKGHIASTVKWGAADGKEGDEIYLSTHIKKNSFNPNPFFSMMSSSSTLTLWRSSDGGNFFEEIIEHCYNFGVEGNFIFASVIFNITKSEHTRKRIMHVSKDSGANFHPVSIPEITSDRFYAVLEMHKGMIFLHVDDDQDTGKGTLFISGAGGLMYTKSLEHHFYTNSGFTDFTRVESMSGVYTTQVLQADNTLKSVITFDRGVSWQPMYVNKDKYCKIKDVVCSLHFHKDYSKANRHIDVQGPLSSASAPGIVLTHGQAGDALTGTIQVWLSTNGGYNWTKIADNPHHYAIGDNGNLLVVVPKINNTGNILKYSIDQGRCWHDLKFHDDAQEMVIRGLVTEPHAKDRMFSLWGYFKDAPTDKKEWNVITINFHGMFSRKCVSHDFDEWSPHILNKKLAGCFLGEKLYYKKPKLTSNCYLGKDFKPLLKTLKCKCSNDDVECDYGYERQPDGTCKENKSIKPIEVCQKGEKMKERFSKGYRRVPGDVCKSEESSNDIVKLIDEGVKCEPSKIDIYGVVKEEKEEKRVLVKEEKEDKTESFKVKAKARPMWSKGHSFFILVGVLVIIGSIIGGGWYAFKFIRGKRNVKPTYLMSDLTDEQEDQNSVIFDPKPATERRYRDQSDIEDDVMLPV